ncbi:EAL domain-containing protein [Lysobacter sp. D1-1-M9]|uniref:EAL domain-containing protein n=2 Tax=Novilysobacter TaxID=3382699 RepID=UPI0031FFFBB9
MWLTPVAETGAATRDFYFTQLGSDHGLAQNTVTALAQDPQGFVWVGTQGGLHRYDGQRYTLFRHDPRDPTSLPDSYITALAFDRDALWIGTYSEYVARLDLGSGTIRRFDTPAGRGRAHGQVRAVLARAGTVWIGTNQGLERLDPASGRRDTVLQLDTRTLRGGPWQKLLADREGRIWYATAAGLFRIEPDGAVLRVGPPIASRTLALDRDGRIWVGRSDGLFRVSPDGSALIRAWSAGDGGGEADVRAIAQAPDGRLWFSVARGGLRRFDLASGRISVIQEEPGVDATLPEDEISALMIDHGGMLWTGGQLRGVAVTDPRGARFRYLFSQPGAASDRIATNDSIRTVHEGGDGALWIGTDDARLLRYDINGDRFGDWTARLPPTSDAQPRRIVSIRDAGHGRMWLGTSHGLLRLEPSTGTVEPIGLGDGASGDFSGTSLRAVLTDQRGDMWLGTRDIGALHVRRDGRHVVNYSHRDDDPRRLAHPTVHALQEDERGRIWFGTGDGLDMLDPVDGPRHYRHDIDDPASLAGNLVRALHVDHDGALWVGTHSGLSRAVEQPDGSISFTHPLAEAMAGAPVPVVFSIIEAVPGELWLGTDAGIVRLDIASGDLRQYGLADGLQDLEFNGNAATLLSDGRMVFGGVRGLNLFEHAGVADAGHTPPVRLLSARIGTQGGQSSGVLWKPDTLEVPDDAVLLRLRIGAMDFSPNADIRYRYRMDGFDTEWIDNGGQADITYTRLPPGRYTFRAQASNRDGVWAGQELQVPVHVAPPLWRHPLSLTALTLAGLALAMVVAWRWHSQRRREQGYFAQIREREERLQLALWASGEQFWDYDITRRELHGMHPHDQGAPGPQLTTHAHLDAQHEIHPDDQARVIEHLRQHLRGEEPLFLSEHRVRNDSDGWSWVRARGRVVESDADGRALRVAGTARDITASRSAERDRRIASEVLRSMAEAVAVFDGDFNFVSVNPAFERMTGFSDSEVAGQPTRLIDSRQHDPAFYQQMRAELHRDGRWSGEIWQQRKDGSEFLCWLQTGVVHEAGGQRGHYVAVVSDITDQKRAEQELRYLANYDTLTGLPNRTLLADRLSRAIVRARHNGRKIALLFLDLDRFKDINDSLGHAAGDRILRAAAHRLQHTVGPQHTVARLGGDEFTVVLENLDDAEQAEQVARDVLLAFETPLDFDERHEVAISPSIGIALYPDHAQVPNDLLKHADTAMYQAKTRGRRTWMRYLDSMDIEVRQRITITAALRKVLDRGELQLVFQPQLSLPDNRITGVEALLRWNSPEYGQIAPAQFIPLAEETGMIVEIGEWVLREACVVLARWRAQGLGGLTMAVNVSALQLLRGDLPQVVARVLESTGVPPECLELELTESVIMTNAEHTGSVLQRFREIGVGLAIDDFGTGYSSLAYLKRLPITTLKIDKEFIDDLTHDADDEAITSTVITMAHSLGLNVIAEGVETEGQVQFLREHGCDEIQGFWLARPLDPQACLEFLRRWPAAAASTTQPEALTEAPSDAG